MSIEIKQIINIAVVVSAVIALATYISNRKKVALETKKLEIEIEKLEEEEMSKI